MLADLRVRIRDDVYCVVSLTDPDDQLRNGAAATIVEDEAVTLVITTAQADARSLPYDFPAAWVTVDVHSSLHALGLTAILAGRLSDHGIPCNVLAGFYHDHLLVPSEERHRVKAVLESRQ